MVTALFDELVELLRKGTADRGRGRAQRRDAARRARRRPAEVLTLDILSARGRTIRPKTLNQKRYVDAIDKHTIVFAIGPAGTGKTYLAMAKAVKALQAKEVNRIILTRPGGRGRRAAGIPARHAVREDRPVPAPAVRRAARHDRPRLDPAADGRRHHRGRPPGVHAGPRAAGRHPGADARRLPADRRAARRRPGDRVERRADAGARRVPAGREGRSTGSPPRTVPRRCAAASTCGP